MSCNPPRLPTNDEMFATRIEFHLTRRELVRWWFRRMWDRWRYGD